MSDSVEIVTPGSWDPLGVVAEIKAILHRQPSNMAPTPSEESDKLREIAAVIALVPRDE